MPGPSNSKRKKKPNQKAKGKKRVEGDSGHGNGGPKPPILSGRLSPEPPAKKPASKTTGKGVPKGPRQQSRPSQDKGHTSSYDDSDSYPPSPLLTPPPTNLLDFQFAECPESYHSITLQKYSSTERIVPEERLDEIERALNKPPFIHDPGNGPRVRDTKEFLESEFFSQPPAFDDPLCAEFAQAEVLQMLQTVLPDDMARIIWYNKSRATGRICPACQRLYRLGDILPEHDTGRGNEPSPPRSPAPQQKQEQRISGLCSPVCFVLASFTFPDAIKGAWGKMAEDIDDISWEILNAPGSVQPRNQSDTSAALGMIVRMTRLHDLGLAQLCFGEEEGVSDQSASALPEPLPS